MKMSSRETVLGLLTLAAVLFGLTYWLAGSHVEEHRTMRIEKARLLHEIELNKKIMEQKDGWYERLEALQSRLPVYDTKISIGTELVKQISRTADGNGLYLVRTQPSGEKQTGSLYEINVTCSWEGTLDALVKFLYELQKEGIRFDVRQITAQPDAQRDRILKGSMTISCAYLKNAKPAP